MGRGDGFPLERPADEIASPDSSSPAFPESRVRRRTRPSPVDERQDIQTVFDPDAAEIFAEDLGPLVLEAIPQAFPGGRQPDDVLDVVELLVEDHPGGGEVVADLRLGLGDERVPDEPGSDKKGQEAAQDE